MILKRWKLSNRKKNWCAKKLNAENYLIKRKTPFSYSPFILQGKDLMHGNAGKKCLEGLFIYLVKWCNSSTLSSIHFLSCEEVIEKFHSF